MRQLHLSAVLLAAFVLTVEAAQAAEFSCPATLATEQSVPLLPPGLPPGARAMEAPLGNGVARLTYVEIYSGKPEEGASLVPDSNNKNSARWRFGSTESITIGCHYTNTRMMIFLPVPGHPRQCDVTYKDAKLLQLRSIQCG